MGQDRSVIPSTTNELFGLESMKKKPIGSIDPLSGRFAILINLHSPSLRNKFQRYDQILLQSSNTWSVLLLETTSN